jgi:hypothetical protein
LALYQNLLGQFAAICPRQVVHLQQARSAMAPKVLPLHGHGRYRRARSLRAHIGRPVAQSSRMPPLYGLSTSMGGLTPHLYAHTALRIKKIKKFLFF